jgi:hypothetical protein
MWIFRDWINQSAEASCFRDDGPGWLGECWFSTDCGDDASADTDDYVAAQKLTIHRHILRRVIINCRRDGSVPMAYVLVQGARDRMLWHG